MTPTKQRKVSCAGYGGHAGMQYPCGSPALPVERSGRCIRCDRLQRRDELAHADPFVSVNDMALPGEGAYREMVATALRPAAPVVVAAVEAEPVAAVQWTPLWPHCLACGTTESAHAGGGICDRCQQRGRSARKRGGGVAVVWLPFAADDPTRYDHAGAKRWCFLVDRTEAWRYLERRAAAGGIPTGGKAVIRAASKAGELPETVIRRAA